MAWRSASQPCPFGDLAATHRQQRLAAVKYLYLRFFIDSQHDRMGWRRDIEADHVPHLVDKIGIRRQLERAPRELQRTIHGLWDAIGRIIDLFTQQECDNYFANCGYDAD